MAKATVMREPRSVARVKPTQTNRNRMEDRRNGQGGGGASTASAAPLPQCKVKRNYACTKCNYYTQNPRFFLFHQKNVHAEKIRVYECQHCLYASKHSQKLQRHIQMVHVAGKGKGSFKIKLQRVVKPDAQACQQQSAAGGVPDNNGGGRRRSTSQAAADDQPAATAVADDHRSTYVRCSVCPFGSHSQILVNRHEKVAHLKKKFFRCMKCNYVTHMKARYTKHVKYHTMPMIKCDDCDFRTPYKWNLDRHNRNHVANGTYKCHHCSFSADIKQSLTVHEMNHHVPPIGNVFPATKRRYRVGASDAPGSAVDGTEIVTYETAKDGVVEIMTETKSTPNSSAKANPVKSIVTKAVNSDGNISVNLFSCSSCDFKSAFECDVKTHMDRSHSVALAAAAAAKKKQSPRPLPRLIPIDQQQQQRFKPAAAAPPVIRIISTKATVSEEDYNRLKANAAQSALSDFASLIDEDGFKPPTGSDQQQQQQATSSTSTFGGGGGGDRSNSGSPRSSKASSSDGGSGHSKRTGSSFFDKLKAKVDETSDLKCDVCQHESKCLSEFMCHQRTHGDVKPEEKNVSPVVATLSSSELKSTRCQHCRKRCKTSAELKVHLNTCEAAAAAMATSVKVETNDNDGGGGGRTIKREEMGDEGTAAAQSADDVDGAAHHPMENKIFVWNTAPACAPAQEELKQETIVTPPTTTTDVKSEEDQPDQSDQRGEFYSNLVLQPHQQFHRKEGKMYKTVFKCPHCTFWASTASRFHVHIVGHLNKKPFECSFCAYRSNWRWDITKHIRLKSARDNSHQGAKVLMTDETGRRNYTKYNRYLTVMEVDDKVDCDGGARGVGGGTRMQQVGGRRRTQKAQAYGQPAVAVKPVSGGGGKQASSGGGKQASSGGGSRQSNSGKQATSGKAVVVPSIPCSKLVDVTTVSAAKTIAVLKTEDGHGHQLLVDGQDGQVKKFKISRVSATNKVTPVVPSADNRKTVWKCKKCFFRDCDRLTVLNHVKAHYRRGEFSGPSAQQSISTEAKSSSSSASDSTKKEKVVPPPTNNAKPLSAKTFILYGDDKTTLSCSLCDVKSRTQAELKEHMQKHIPQETKYRCEYCPFWSEEKKAMLDHMKYAHEMEDGGGEQTHHPDDSRVKNAKRNGESDVKDEQDEAMEVGEPTKYEADDRPSMDMSSEPIEQGKSTVVVNGLQPKEEKELGLEAKTDARLPAEKRAFEDDCQYDDDAEFPRDLELKSSECIPCNVCWYYSTTKPDMAAHKQLHVRRGALYNCDRCVYNVTKLSLLYDHYRCAHMVDEPERAYPEDAVIRAGYREMLAKNHVDDGDRANETPMLWSYKDGTFAKVYKCRHCPHTNGRRHNTLEHEKMHSDHSEQPGTGSDAMHPCKLCTYVCNNAGVLSSHLKVHADDYNSVIAFWDSAVGDQAQIKALEHVIRLESDLDPTLVDRGVDDGGLKFCKWCPARYLSVADLRCHDRGHRFSWSYACQHCTYSARTEEFIALHRPLHEDEYKTRTDQLVAEHGVSRRYPRPGRSDKAKSPPPSAGHGSTGAGGSTKPLTKGYVRQFTCTKCPGRFFKIAALQYHLTLHGGPGQHKCRRCDYAVSTYGNLIRHETVHEDLPPRERRSRGANKALAAGQPPPSPTSIADALKESSSSLKAIAARAAIAAQAAAVAQAAADDGNTESTADPEFGTQIHGNPIFYYPTTVKNGVAKQKRYKCPKCPSAFDKREQYKVHLTLHGANDKYKCDKCDYSVKYTANYVQHQRKHALHAELRNVAAAGIVVFDNEIEEEEEGNDDDDVEMETEAPEEPEAAVEQTAAVAEEEQVQPEPETEPPVPAAEPVQDKQEPPQQEQRSSRRSVNFRHHHRRGGCAAGGEERPTPTANNTTRTKKFRDEISDAQTAFELESAYAEVFKCIECPFVCGARAELDKHVVHHSSKRWKRVCTFCTYVTQTESDLSDHMRVHFGRPPVARDMPPADGRQPLNAANDDDDDRQLEYYGKRVFERDEPHDVRDEESFFVFRDMGDRFDGSIRFTPKGCEPLIDFNENSTVKPTFVRLLKGGKVELPDKKKKKK